MRASLLRTGSVPIGFRVAFGHAAAIRSAAENILVYLEDAEGRFGLGEGCPRDYVTGEDVGSCLAFIDAHAATLQTLDSVVALRGWIAANALAIDANPSAFCAVELALLDLFGRQQGKSVESLLGIQPASAPIFVSSVYGTGAALIFRAQAFAFAGIRDAKLKLSGDGTRDRARARMLARRGTVRLDANNLWSDAISAIVELTPLATSAWAVEEPIAPRDWEGLREIHRQTGLAIILDESFVTRADLDAAPEDINVIPNFRVSKLGGLLRSLDCLNHTQGAVIVGAQVGETSILARAGLALAWAAGQRLNGFEGAYGRILLKHDIVRPSLGFGLGGRVRDANFRGAPGFGLSPAPALKAALVKRREDV